MRILAPSSSFLRVLGALGALGLLAGCAATASSERSWNRRTFEHESMGTLFRIVLYERDGGDPEHPRRAAAAAFRRVDELNDLLSDYDSESELSVLCRASDERAPTDFLDVSPELFHVCSYAHELSRASGGAFDVTVGPYVRLWRRARRQGSLPGAVRLQQAGRSVGFEKLELDPAAKRIRLGARSMRLDLGGIAKGYAVDEALRVLEAAGFARALVDGGGDIAVGDAPPLGAGWRVALATRGDVQAPIDTRADAWLQHAAIATSGDSERSFELDGVRYSHLVDPRSGQALTSRRLVTVIAPTCIEADALASALSVLEFAAFDALLRAYPRAEARVLSLPGDEVEEWRTAGFEAALSSAAPLRSPVSCHE